MGLRYENDRERLEAGTSVPARDGSEAVSHLKPTEGAANSGHLSPPSPRKPDGLLRISRKQLIAEFPRVKMASGYEYAS
jgi:hypothetical protein